jgi:hypothetical protein
MLANATLRFVASSQSVERTFALGSVSWRARRSPAQTVLAIAAGAALLGGSGAALAVDIGGLNIPLGSTFAVASVYENVVTGVGQTLSGYGEVSAINGVATNTLCSGCELTYRFTDYIVSSISATDIKFSGGVVTFYLGFGANNDFNPSASASSAADLAAATNGTVFLNLMGHAIDAAGNTFAGTGVNIGSTTPSGTGSGLADVNMSGSGIANTYFNTNSVPASFGGSSPDFLLTSSFSGLFPPHPSECTQGQGLSCLSGSADFRGSVAAIPEPGTYALMFAGLGVVGLVVRRRRQQR